MDVIYAERSDYTFLNFLGDVGALSGVLFSLSVIVLENIFFMNIDLENTLIENVFKSRPTEKSSKTFEVKVTYF